MSFHQAYELYVLDRRLAGSRIISADQWQRLCGIVAPAQPQELAALNKQLRWFQGSSRSGWLVSAARRVICASGIRRLDFLHDEDPDRTFTETLSDASGNEVWSNTVCCTFLDTQECLATADALAQLIQWCRDNPLDAARHLECTEHEIAASIERAHTIANSDDVHVDDGQGAHYFFCVVTTLRDLLNRACSVSWVGLYKLYELV